MIKGGGVNNNAGGPIERLSSKVFTLLFFLGLKGSPRPNVFLQWIPIEEVGSKSWRGGRDIEGRDYDLLGHSLGR